MLQTKLITLTDIQNYCDVSDNVYTKVLNSQIIAAQLQDVAPLLGEKLFNAILNDAASYTDLLDGGEYTVNGETYYNYGLKAVLSHYAYARYVLFGSVKDTPFSLTEKLNGAESRPVDSRVKKDIYNLNRDSAFTIWVSVENYLKRTNEPLYIGCNISRPNNHFKISKIV